MLQYADYSPYGYSESLGLGDWSPYPAFHSLGFNNLGHTYGPYPYDQRFFYDMNGMGGLGDIDLGLDSLISEISSGVEQSAKTAVELGKQIGKQKLQQEVQKVIAKYGPNSPQGQAAKKTLKIVAEDKSNEINWPLYIGLGGGGLALVLFILWYASR